MKEFGRLPFGFYVFWCIYWTALFICFLLDMIWSSADMSNGTACEVDNAHDGKITNMSEQYAILSTIGVVISAAMMCITSKKMTEGHFNKYTKIGYYCGFCDLTDHGKGC